MEEGNITMYLQHIGWGTKAFSPYQMKIMLGAGLLRFLGGRTNLSFVFGLNDAISQQKEALLDETLLRVTLLLQYLHDEVSSLAENDETIKRKCQFALSLLTKDN